MHTSTKIILGRGGIAYMPDEFYEVYFGITVMVWIEEAVILSKSNPRDQHYSISQSIQHA